LHAHDFQRMNNLSDLLKKARVNESSNPYAYECHSPVKLNENSSPRVSSPTSITITNSTSNKFNQIQPSVPVMTQISSICNKRSRSTNN
jgi:hypothetical protein